MASCEWIIMCDESGLDELGKPYIYGITDRFWLPKVPVAVDHITVVYRVVGESDELVPVRFEVLRPSGAVLDGLAQDVPLQLSPVGSAIRNISLDHFWIYEYGIHSIAIRIGETVKIQPFLVAPQSERPKGV